MMYDLLIIGGGINGAGIACDAAGRGLKVFLCEKQDFASGTSSASSKLIHGGLRYLEQFNFSLVKEALTEREILLLKARHLIEPINFSVPNDGSHHPWWEIRLGLYLYDHLAKKRLLPDSTAHLSAEQALPLKANFQKGFCYADCRVDDARLVIANLLQAEKSGAVVKNYHECVAITTHADHTEVKLLNRIDNTYSTIRAKILINAAGAWVDDIRRLMNPAQDNKLVKVKGSHIVVKKWYAGPQAYLLQNDDKRVVFVIPYLTDFVLIGTTDEPYGEKPEAVTISEDEKDYLLRIVNAYFLTSLTKAEIVWSYSGVRALYNDRETNLSKISRDYVIVEEECPLRLHIYGGKITTYRRLSEKVLQKICYMLSLPDKPWTAQCKLPGGEFEDIEHFMTALKEQYHWLDPKIMDRLAHAYGTQIHKLLAGKNSVHDLGKHFGAGLYEAEVDYLKQNEWCVFADDLLWRRSKLGLFKKTLTFPRHMWYKL